jgi:hypothetical protein
MEMAGSRDALLVGISVVPAAVGVVNAIVHWRTRRSESSRSRASAGDPRGVPVAQGPRVWHVDVEAGGERLVVSFGEPGERMQRSVYRLEGAAAHEGERQEDAPT